jgi:hypothetical protein
MFGFKKNPPSIKEMMKLSEYTRVESGHAQIMDWELSDKIIWLEDQYRECTSSVEYTLGSDIANYVYLNSDGNSKAKSIFRRYCEACAGNP